MSTKNSESETSKSNSSTAKQLGNLGAKVAATTLTQVSHESSPSSQSTETSVGLAQQISNICGPNLDFQPRDKEEAIQADGLTPKLEHKSFSSDRTALLTQNPAAAPQHSGPLDGAIADFWNVPAVITPNNFKNKSLSDWSFNTTIGCVHGCLFCYVPSVSTNKMAIPLGKLGVDNPDLRWGNYVFVRYWDERKFLASLRKAENTPVDKLKPDGNRAIMFCSTTDAYQVIKHPDPQRQRELQRHHQFIVRRALELILEHSTLNVRILTRSPLARLDFDIMRKLGTRCLFGMSIPTLNDKLAKVYEPGAPSVTQRLETLKAAKKAGLHVFVAIAPTYPECDEADLRATLKAVAELDPVTVFHEPINIRAENVARIQDHAAELGVELNTEVFNTPFDWESYALGQLHTVEQLAAEVGLGDRLHLWPDQSLGWEKALSRSAHPELQKAWLNKWWSRISEWPTQETALDPSNLGNQPNHVA